MRYSFIYTKLRARKSRFLDAAFYEKLLATENLEAALRMLSSTLYADDIAGLLSGEITNEVIDSMLTQHYTSEYESLARYLPGKARVYAELYEKRVYFNAVKSIIHSVHAGLETEEIDGLLTVTADKREELLNLANLGSIARIIENSADKGLRKIMQQTHDQYMATGDVVLFDLAIDKFYYTMLADGLEKVLRGYDRVVARKYIGTMVEMLNVITILRSLQYGISVDESRKYLIDYFYRLKSNKVKLIQAKTTADVFNALDGTTYGTILQKYLGESAKISSIRDLELGFQKFLYDQSRKLWLSPFNIGNFLAYFETKKVEIQNLRSLLLGKLNGLEVQDIKLIT